MDALHWLCIGHVDCGLWTVSSHVGLGIGYVDYEQIMGAQGSVM